MKMGFLVPPLALALPVAAPAKVASENWVLAQVGDDRPALARSAIRRARRPSQRKRTGWWRRDAR